jgi:Putative beta-barrel porin-2, OmpL-like. bbp2/Carboxypeptidase regulatory-like domain
MKSVSRKEIIALAFAVGLVVPGVCGAQSLGTQTLQRVSFKPAHNRPVPLIGSELRGTIQNSKGAPIAGAEVLIHSVDDESDRTLASDHLGYFVVEDLKPGRYQLRISAKGFASASAGKTIQVAPQESLRVDVTLADASAPAGSSRTQTLSSATVFGQNSAGASNSAESAGANAPALLASNVTPSAPATGAASPATTSAPATSADSEVPAAVAKQLESMEARIEELEAVLKARDSAPAAQPAVSPASPAPAAAIPVAAAPGAESTSAAAQAPAGTAPVAAAPAAPNFAPQRQTKADPFSYADYTWLNGTPRNEDTPLATKYFTPEVRFDTNYMEDYNQPKDHTMGGSTESFRSDEVQLEQMSFGGDIHVDNVRGRVLTMFGLFSTTTPRNDGSAGVGQWNLNDAYKYFSEAWGGYHFNVNHGLNIDAGIFVSYIGLFSYYNFDNWTYQPSFVSSNTPWFFNGVRIQWFPTEKLKIEPWFINGWQSYAKYNGHPGLGGQILWRPTPYLSMVFNNYGMGTDTLGNPGRSRIHTDDSLEMRYYNHPNSYGLDKMAFSVTGDLGCEYGGGVSCHNDSNGHPKQMFAGWMLYNRFWFHKDLFGLTLGGGVLDNPGRYLTLLQPINGATAVSGSPYFPAYPGSVYKGWDSTVTFDWMPSQFITFRGETGYRYSNVPYWSGRGGITPPGGNVGPVAYNGSVGTGASYICTNGATSVVAPLPLSGYSGQGLAVDNAGGAVTAACTSLNSSPTLGTSGPWSVWQPDLRKDQWVNTIAIMVKW